METKDLRDLMIAIESQAFQKLVVEPIKKEMENLKHAYNCKTLVEMATLKGKREGLQIVIDRLKIAHEEYENNLHNENL